MSFIPVPNTAQIVFNAVQNTIPVVNVYHVRFTHTPTESDLGDIAAVFLGWWRDNIKGGLHESYVLINVTATDISSADSIQVVLPAVSTDHGVGVGDAAAANAALCVSWRTARIGRSFRGRTYFGGLSNSALSDAQTFDSTFAAGFVTAATNLIDAVETLGAVLVVVSRYADKVARIVGLATQIVGVIVDLKVDSQRKRNSN